MLRCASSSIAGVAIEFGILTLLVSVLHLFYLLGAVLAGGIYCGVSFLLNRHWAFRAAGSPAWPQFARHAIVAAGGAVLGLPLLWLLVQRLGLPYQLAWAVGGALSFLLWTFPMQRFFTYRLGESTVNS
jgi:putative flippase GtrA